MKKTLLMTFAILMIASVALAQPGSIGLFVDTAALSCNILDAAPGPCNVFVVHTGTVGATASEFGISSPPCILASFLSYAANWAVDIAADAGAPLDGRSVGYGGCLSSPIHVATLSYFCQGLTAPCCLQSIIPHIITGVISVVDCDSNLLPATGGAARWNADTSCSCTVGTHTSTWGNIKSMFE